jgi:hypothetical protein
MNPILNYMEFRTNPEPYMVQGMVHGSQKKKLSSRWRDEK